MGLQEPHAGDLDRLASVPGIRGLHIGTSPYDSFPRILQVPNERPAGSVLIVILDPEELVDDPAAPRERLLNLRRNTLDCALVASLTGVAAIHVTLLRRLGFVGLRAFVPRHFNEESLRSTLGAANLPREDVASWLTMRLDPSVRYLAHAFALALETQDHTWLPQLRRVPHALVPGRRKWAMLVKLLRPLVRLQSTPGVTIEEVARRSPYSDSAAFHKACRGLLGVGPSEVRSLLGWEWILDRFIRTQMR